MRLAGRYQPGDFSGNSSTKTVVLSCFPEVSLNRPTELCCSSMAI